MRPETNWIVSILRNRPGDFALLNHVAADFGWRVAAITEIHDLAQSVSSHRVIAVLFNPDELGGKSPVLAELARLAPGIRLISCLEPWSYCRESLLGAYSTLMLPLNESELRQTLGFIWATIVSEEQTTERHHASFPELTAS